MPDLWKTLGVALIGALVPILLAALFRKQLAEKIAGSTEIEIEWGKLKLKFKGSEAERVLKSLFQEMRVLIDLVPLAERRNVLTKIESHENRVRVMDIYPNFKRESDEHRFLRSLRDAQFIRPVGSGQFQAESLLQLKQFGRLMLQYHRKYILENEPF